MAASITAGVHLELLHWQCASLSIWVLVYLSLLHEFCSQVISFGIRFFSIWAMSENVIQGVRTKQGIPHVPQCSIISRCISSIHLEVEQGPCALNCANEYWTLIGASTLSRLGYNSKQVPAHLLHLVPIPLRNFLIRLMFWCEVVLSRHGWP